MQEATTIASNANSGELGDLHHEMACADMLPPRVRQLVLNAPEKIAVSDMIDERWEEWEMLAALAEIYSEYGVSLPSSDA